jgi:hypothetical protein
MSSQIKLSADLWDLEHYLTQRRKEIDRKYDFRGSRLTDVLGNSCTKIDSMKSARLTREQAGADSFFRQILGGGRGLTCILRDRPVRNIKEHAAFETYFDTIHFPSFTRSLRPGTGQQNAGQPAGTERGHREPGRGCFR